MEIQVFDILLLILITIALALIMGSGIIYFVDKKLNDIQINVPACPVPVCPTPVCTNQETKSDYNQGNQESRQKEETIEDNKEEFQTFALDPLSVAHAMNDGIDLDSNYAPIEKQLIDDSGITIRPEPVNPNGQPIAPLVLTQDSENNKAKMILLRQGYSSSPTDTSNIGDKITYPDADDVVRYNGDGCYKDDDIRYMRKLQEKDLITDSCRPYAASTKEEAYNKYKLRMMTAGSNSANYAVDEKINFYVPRLYMGRDPTISGVSYAQMSVETPADIDQIGSIPVDNYDGEPVPLSAFSND